MILEKNVQKFSGQQRITYVFLNPIRGFYIVNEMTLQFTIKSHFKILPMLILSYIIPWQGCVGCAAVD